MVVGKSCWKSLQGIFVEPSQKVLHVSTETLEVHVEFVPRFLGRAHPAQGRPGGDAVQRLPAVRG